MWVDVWAEILSQVDSSSHSVSGSPFGPELKEHPLRFHLVSEEFLWFHCHIEEYFLIGNPGEISRSFYRKLNM